MDKKRLSELKDTLKHEFDIVFDKKMGMPSSYDYKATIIQNDEDGSVNKMPITVTYTLRDPEVVKNEREAARQRLEERKKKEELERTTPNPELVDQLLADIRKEEGGDSPAGVGRHQETGRRVKTDARQAQLWPDRGRGQEGRLGRLFRRLFKKPLPLLVGDSG